MRKEEEGNQQNGNEHLPKTSNRVNEKYSKNFPEFKMYLNGFPDSSVVKNVPANAGDTGSILDPGRSHRPWSNKAHVPLLPSLCSRTQELNY